MLKNALPLKNIVKIR